MDRVVTFVYAVGNGEELRKGELDVLGTSDSYEGLERYLQTKGLIIIPQFIGVYQKEEIIAHNVSEEKGAEGLRGTLEVLNSSLAHLSNLVLGPETRDNIHQDLIHVVYDSDIFNEYLVRQCLGDNLKRIAVSTKNEVPNFYNKDTDVVNRFLEEILENGLRRKCDRYLGFLRAIQEQSELYGLTRCEFSVLKIAQQKVGTLLTDHSLLSSFSSLFDSLSKIRADQ